MSALQAPLASDFGLGGEFRGWATAPPADGPSQHGDLLLNALPAANGLIGWVCVEDGTPGVWRPWGAIA